MGDGWAKHNRVGAVDVVIEPSSTRRTMAESRAFELERHIEEPLKRRDFPGPAGAKTGSVPVSTGARHRSWSSRYCIAIAPSRICSRRGRGLAGKQRIARAPTFHRRNRASAETAPRSWRWRYSVAMRKASRSVRQLRIRRPSTPRESSVNRLPDQQPEVRAAGLLAQMSSSLPRSAKESRFSGSSNRRASSPIPASTSVGSTPCSPRTTGIASSGPTRTSPNGEPGARPSRGDSTFAVAFIAINFVRKCTETARRQA